MNKREAELPGKALERLLRISGYEAGVRRTRLDAEVNEDIWVVDCVQLGCEPGRASAYYQPIPSRRQAAA